MAPLGLIQHVQEWSPGGGELRLLGPQEEVMKRGLRSTMMVLDSARQGLGQGQAWPRNPEGLALGVEQDQVESEKESPGECGLPTPGRPHL